MTLCNYAQDYTISYSPQWTNWSASAATMSTASAWDNWSVGTTQQYATTITVPTAVTIQTQYPVWVNWCGADTVTIEYEWQHWNTQLVIKAPRVTTQLQQPNYPRTYTPEETEALRRELEENRRRNDEMQKRLREAEARAEKLLREILKPEQEAEYERTKSFTIFSKCGVKFRINDGQHGNVDELDAEGRVVATYCCYLPDTPKSDTMIAQKLMIEHMFDEFKKKANRSVVTPFHRPPRLVNAAAG